MIQSHLHYDHAGGLEFFPGTLVIVQQAELDFAFTPPTYQADMYVPADFESVENWKAIEGEHDVFGDGSLVVFPTAGQIRGHQSLLVRLPGQPMILLADAAYAPRSIEQSILPGVPWSPDAMIESWERVRAMRNRERAQLVLTHDREYRSNTKAGSEQPLPVAQSSPGPSIAAITSSTVAATRPKLRWNRRRVAS